MRTTLDIDDALLARVQAMFPPGTPKTVLLEEGLRRLLGAERAGVEPARPRRDPRMQKLIEEGHITPTSRVGPRDPPPAGPGGVQLIDLLADLAHDREDRR